MKPVVQLERTGCGIASVAALAGVSYWETQRVANRLGIVADDPRLWSETGYVRRLLKEFGIQAGKYRSALHLMGGPAGSCAARRQMAQRAGVARSGIGSCFGEDRMDLSCSTRSVNFATMCAPTSVA